MLKKIAQERAERKDRMNDLVIATIRTFVPSLVGSFTVFMTARGFALDAAAMAGLEAFLLGLAISSYYLAVRLLSKRFPQAEVLLGFNKKPEYVEPKREI